MQRSEREIVDMQKPEVGQTVSWVIPSSREVTLMMKMSWQVLWLHLMTSLPRLPRRSRRKRYLASLHLSYHEKLIILVIALVLFFSCIIYFPTDRPEDNLIERHPLRGKRCQWSPRSLTRFPPYRRWVWFLEKCPHSQWDFLKVYFLDMRGNRKGGNEEFPPWRSFPIPTAIAVTCRHHYLSVYDERIICLSVCLPFSLILCFHLSLSLGAVGCRQSIPPKIEDKTKEAARGEKVVLNLLVELVLLKQILSMYLFMCLIYIFIQFLYNRYTVYRGQPTPLPSHSFLTASCFQSFSPFFTFFIAKNGNFFFFLF